MPQEKEVVLSRAKLTKRIKVLRKATRELKKSSASNEAVEALEKRIDSVEKMQSKLMHNLRRVMRHMDLNPENPRG